MLTKLVAVVFICIVFTVIADSVFYSISPGATSQHDREPAVHDTWDPVCNTAYAKNKNKKMNKTNITD